MTVAGPGAVLVLPFSARLVHVVAAGDGDVVVTVDGKPLAADTRPKGVTVRADGATVVHVGHSDLYTVVALSSFGAGVLRLEPAAGITIYSFTFGA
jgi:hypothetical protein